jgi:hypothetical protein
MKSYYPDNEISEGRSYLADKASISKEDLEDTNWIDRHLMIDSPKFQNFIIKFTLIICGLTALYIIYHLIKYWYSI